MEYIIHNSKQVNGELHIPGDKSISHRSIMLGSIARGTTVIDGFLMGEDCISTINCFKTLGIDIEMPDPKKILVHGKGMHGLHQPTHILDAGNSGTTSRIMLGILAGQSFDSSITGDLSLQKRPMKRVITPLTLMGARIKSSNKSMLLPLHIEGNQLHGIDYKLSVASAQLKSSLIMAGLFADQPVKITEQISSRNHTELMLATFGGSLAVKDHTITVHQVEDLYAQEIIIPGDISSAAYFITAALILPNSQITIRNVGINPTRTGILEVYKAMGAKIDLENIKEQNGELIADITAYSSSLSSTCIEGDMIPRLIDEIPIIAVAAAFANGTTTIRDAQELKIKESNRIQSMVNELSKMNVNISETSDGMIIQGGNILQGGIVENYMDHRVTMSMAIAALGAMGSTTIKGAEYINTSFPQFHDILNRITR